MPPTGAIDPFQTPSARKASLRSKCATVSKERLSVRRRETDVSGGAAKWLPLTRLRNPALRHSVGIFSGRRCPECLEVGRIPHFDRFAKVRRQTEAQWETRRRSREDTGPA